MLALVIRLELDANDVHVAELWQSPPPSPSLSAARFRKVKHSGTRLSSNTAIKLQVQQQCTDVVAILDEVAKQHHHRECE